MISYHFIKNLELLFVHFFSNCLYNGTSFQVLVFHFKSFSLIILLIEKSLLFQNISPPISTFVIGLSLRNIMMDWWRFSILFQADLFKAFMQTSLRLTNTDVWQALLWDQLKLYTFLYRDTMTPLFPVFTKWRQFRIKHNNRRKRKYHILSYFFLFWWIFHSISYSETLFMINVKWSFIFSFEKIRLKNIIWLLFIG